MEVLEVQNGDATKNSKMENKRWG